MLIISFIQLCRNIPGSNSESCFRLSHSAGEAALHESHYAHGIFIGTSSPLQATHRGQLPPQLPFVFMRAARLQGV